MVGIDHHQHQRPGTVGGGRDRLGGDAAGLRERGASLRPHVEAADGKAVAHEVAGHRQAHRAEADESDGALGAYSHSRMLRTMAPVEMP